MVDGIAIAWIVGCIWLQIGFAVLLNSIMKYILITICNKRASVTEIMMWGTLAPLLGAISDPLVFHKSLHPRWACK